MKIACSRTYILKCWCSIHTGENKDDKKNERINRVNNCVTNLNKIDESFGDENIGPIIKIVPIPLAATQPILGLLHEIIRNIQAKRIMQ